MTRINSLLNLNLKYIKVNGDDSLHKIIEEDHVMSIITELTLEETILEICKIMDIKILEVDTEGIIEMIILEDVEVGPGMDNTQVILVEMTEVVVVGLHQVQEPVLKETELHALTIGNMMISLKTVQLCK